MVMKVNLFGLTINSTHRKPYTARLFGVLQCIFYDTRILCVFFFFPQFCTSCMRTVLLKKYANDACLVEKVIKWKFPFWHVPFPLMILTQFAAFFRFFIHLIKFSINTLFICKWDNNCSSNSNNRELHLENNGVFYWKPLFAFKCGTQ